MKHKKVWTVVFIAVGAAVLIVASALGTMQRRTENLHDGWQTLLNDPACQSAVRVDGVEPIQQDISCGYAVIEVLSKWTGGGATEEYLYEENDGVSTSTSEAFEQEINKQIPEYTFQRQIYLRDSALLAVIHESLAAGVPVPVEWAAKDGETWTLHYSIVTGLDLHGDEVEVVNPYGYMEHVSVQEFLDRTSFEAFENMPAEYQLGFAFGLFDKMQFSQESRHDELLLFIPGVKICQRQGDTCCMSWKRLRRWAPSELAP